MPKNDLIKINDSFIMIRRKPSAYALAAGITLVCVTMALGFISMPYEWRTEIIPHLDRIKESYTQQLNQVRADVQDINVRLRAYEEKVKPVKHWWIK